MNPLNITIKPGQIVLIQATYMTPESQAEDKRKFLCKSGQGMKPSTAGRTIYGQWADKKTTGAIYSHWIERLIS